MSRPRQHLLLLGLIVILSLLLRLTELAAKPLWVDEILTVIFSLGHSFDNRPMPQIFPIDFLPNIFTFNPQSCAQIAETVSRESTHPPLFFCLLHGWLGWIKPNASLEEIVWQARFLPAAFGVAATVAMYFLGRVAFSPTTGLIASAFMAVSPFAVYLSQEARHYTLPMLLIILSLTELISMQRNYTCWGKIRAKNWLPWVIFTTLGLYTHYFFILVYFSQIGALFCRQFWLLWRGEKFKSFLLWSRSFYVCLLPLILFSPWLSILLQHSGRPETEWFKPFEPSFLNYIIPLYQIMIGWILMVIALPVETPCLWLTIPSALLMFTFAFLVGKYVWRGLFQSLYSGDCLQRESTIIVCSFILLNLLQFLLIIYLLGKDITSAIRYHFVYHPAICLLMAACFTHPLGQNKRKEKIKLSYSTVLLVGLLSSLCVVYGLVFEKPYKPELVARNLNLEAEKPLIVVSGYSKYQEIALGLEFALELYKQRHYLPTYWLFVDTKNGYNPVWQFLSNLDNSFASKFSNLWIIAPGLRRQDFPSNLSFSGSGMCVIDSQHHYRIGIPYQLYRCFPFSN
ncbi:MAG: glycosyltransferase family 39 protein [Geminocystis sp.]|nr:glycosyltransferase family 39 protein [Geminocystis sp.]MDW8463881.1 glycosyltransferase family 39 protein [Geminocystis sp.]HIK38368.1 glycosyltransferase family 39 protein [Geminocystis sp. M7585_C2015_104]